MSVFSRITRWFASRKTNPQKTPKPAPAKILPKQAQAAAAKEHPQPLVPIKKLPPATGSVKTRVSITVYYRQAGQTKDLLPKKVLHGLPGEIFHMPWRKIEGFIQTAAVGYVPHFPENPQLIYCLYEARMAGPVTVYHRDREGELLTPPEILLGNLNAAFVAEPLPAYKDAVVGQAVQRGFFTTESQSLHFTYALDGLQVGETPKAAYVELMQGKTSYAKPDLQSPALAQSLPAHSLWRVFALVRQPAADLVWLNLGGTLWITAEDTKARADNPYLLAFSPQPKPQPAFAQVKNTVNLTATVQAGDSGVSIWDQPYGKALNQRLFTGKRLHLAALVRLENGSQWFELAEGGYVLGEYLHLHLPPQP